MSTKAWVQTKSKNDFVLGNWHNRSPDGHDDDEYDDDDLDHSSVAGGLFRLFRSRSGVVMTTIVPVVVATTVTRAVLLRRSGGRGVAFRSTERKKDERRLVSKQAVILVLAEL